MAFRTITKDEIETQRIQSMCRVFERVDQVLAQQMVRCRVEVSGPAPAWSDGKTITFNRASIDGVTTVEDLIRLNGLNYHELSHILYTPRDTNATVRQVRGEGLAWIMNILEDQRIETMLTTEYPATIPYFVSIMMRYILQDESKWEKAFPFVYGRKYLPAEIRNSLRDRYTDQNKVKKIAKVIDEYRKITYSGNAMNTRALELIRAFKTLVTEDIINNDPFAHDSRPEDGITEGVPMPEEDQKAIGDKTEKDEKNKPTGSKSEDDKSGDDADGEGEGSEGEGEGDAEADGDGDGTGGGGEKEKSDKPGKGKGKTGSDDDEASEGGDDKGNKGEGEGKTGKSDSDESSGGASIGGDGDLADAIREVIEQTETSEQVRQEISETQKAVKDFTTTDKNYRSELDKPSRVYKFPTTPAMSLASKKIASELSRLSHDLDPGFITHRSSGRLNLKRAMQGTDYDTAFDVWDQGVNTSTDMEVVILVDQSSSMRENMQRVNEALWTIKRAIELASSTANVTVLGYNDVSRTLISGADRESGTQCRNFPSSGGTDPSDALAEARYIFGTTRKERGVLITLTDGLWFGSSQDCDEMVKVIAGAGITTALAYLQCNQGYGQEFTPEQRRKSFGHDHEIFTTIQDPYDLIKFSKEIVKIAMQKKK